MKTIRHVIQADFGLHARPAGRLVKLAGCFTCNILVGTKNTMVPAKSILKVMALGLQKGDELTITLGGEDEEDAAKTFASFLQEHL